MENKNLNDIVIEDAENSKKTQLKNILTLLALLFIILVISIVITKLILGEDSDNPIEKHPVATTDTVNGDAEANATGSSSALAAVAAGTGAAAGAIASGVNSAANTVTDTVKKAPTLTERNSTSSTKQPLTNYDNTKKETKKESSTASSSPKTSTYSRPKYVATAERAATSTPKKESSKNYNPARGYYIKVGAFDDPSTAIKKIKSIDLNYRTIKSSGGLTRVLIGPFYSQKDAADHLGKAKANVAKDAYITKIK
ncbi:MAG TPA: SPOR domain-containing protein [Campylobacterales bacterium]|nr:SPOR domain-containing protein [Campylobacterales bacterium]